MEQVITPTIDRRSEVPDLSPYLKPYPQELVVNIEKPDIKKPTAYPSSVRELNRLTGASHYQEIGATSPAVAARVSTENRAIEALRMFEVLFGRDSLVVAIDLADHYPRLLRTTIIRLAELQGVKEDIRREEEPGKIIHEFRDPEKDERARMITAKRGWGWPYYGSVDATVLYIKAITQYCRESEEGDKFLATKFIGRDDQEHNIQQSLDAAVSWVKARLDYNPDGLLEFKKKFAGSTENQVWKDSWDSYFHSDGTLANYNYGIASIEVQAETYDALLDAAKLYDMLNNSQYSKLAQELRTRAEKLKKVIEDKLWIEDDRGGYYALGADRDEKGNLRPLDIRTSNMGHLLDSKIMDGNFPETIRRKEALVKTLFSPEMLNVSGIRTLSSKEKRFKPCAYHNGSVWAWDNYLISCGLERQGYNYAAWELRKKIWNVVQKFNRFPEFANGGDDNEPQLNNRVVDIWEGQYNRINRIEQPPQEIQAWTVASILASKYKYLDLMRGRTNPVITTSAL